MCIIGTHSWHGIVICFVEICVKKKVLRDPSTHIIRTCIVGRYLPGYLVCLLPLNYHILLSKIDYIVQKTTDLKQLKSNPMKFANTIDKADKNSWKKYEWITNSR